MINAARVDNRHKLQNLTNWQLLANQNRKSAPVGLILLRCLIICTLILVLQFICMKSAVQIVRLIYIYVYNQFPDCDMLSSLLACKWVQRHSLSFMVISTLFTVSVFMLTSCCRVTSSAGCFCRLHSNTCWVCEVKDQRIHSFLSDSKLVQSFPFPQLFLYFNLQDTKKKVTVLKHILIRRTLMPNQM